jgi:tetratricopeptide (TPR) repeat protein
MQDRIPQIDLDKGRFISKKPILNIIIYACLLLIIIISVNYIFFKNSFFDNLNPISQMQNHYKEKNYTKVIDTGSQLLTKYPKSLIIRRYLWKSHLHMKQYGKALKIMHQIQELSPSTIEPSLGYCTIFRLTEEYEKMNYYCEKVLELKANNETAHEQIAQAFIDQKKYKEAKKYLNKLSTELASDNLKRHILLANINILEGNYEESIRILEEARRIFIDEPIIYYYLGECYYHSGKYIKAASFLEKFIDKAYKKDIEVELLESAYIDLASSYEKAKMFSNAYRAYKNAACLTIKLNKTDLTIKLMTRGIASTYAGYTGFVSQDDFKNKFEKLKNELEKKCNSVLFASKED